MDRLASKPKVLPQTRANMTAEESLSIAVRGHLSGAGAMSEVKMFGGTGFPAERQPGCRRVQTRFAASCR